MSTNEERVDRVEATPRNLMEAAMAEMDRLREMCAQYDSLPGGVGIFGSTMMRHAIAEAQAAIVSGDVVALLTAYKAMQEFEG
jgi:hypothetical protein